MSWGSSRCSDALFDLFDLVELVDLSDFAEEGRSGSEKQLQCTFRDKVENKGHSEMHLICVIESAQIEIEIADRDSSLVLVYTN